MKHVSSGQTAVEWAMVMAAIVAAAVIMRPYIVRAIRAGAQSTEMQVTGAMQDNRP